MILLFGLYVIEQLYFSFWFLYVNERFPPVMTLSYTNLSFFKFWRIFYVTTYTPVWDFW